MKLRNAHLAVVDRSKVVDYLLNEAHPDNGGKARFFASLGFSRNDPERLMKALRDVAEQGEVANMGNRCTAPVPAAGLEVGDVGTVVHVYADGKAFEVEFKTLDGKTAAVATVEALAVRPVTGHEIPH